MIDEVDEWGRRLIHRRTVECLGYLRADGLWDIEGRLSDSKTHPVTLAEGRIVAAGQTYHGMLIRLALDDDFIVREVHVAMPDVPTSQCRGAMPGYEKLLGERIGPGFSRRIKELFGGIGGCVHLTELLLPMATTAFQTIPMARAMVAPRTAADTEAYSNATGQLLNTCYALREDGPVAVFLKKTESSLQ
ncbi:dihydroxy-acid dehydratase [Pseudomonas sp. ACM7]|nr:dihydroxy-acid dehydratase [Pseudomonas sp. ACM7]